MAIRQPTTLHKGGHVVSRQATLLVPYPPSPQATLQEAPPEEFSDTGLTWSTEDVAVRSAADARKFRAVNEILVHISLHIPYKD